MHIWIVDQKNLESSSSKSIWVRSTQCDQGMWFSTPTTRPAENRACVTKPLSNHSRNAPGAGLGVWMSLPLPFPRTSVGLFCTVHDAKMDEIILLPSSLAVIKFKCKWPPNFKQFFNQQWAPSIWQTNEGQEHWQNPHIPPSESHCIVAVSSLYLHLAGLQVSFVFRFFHHTKMPGHLLHQVVAYQFKRSTRNDTKTTHSEPLAAVVRPSQAPSGGIAAPSWRPKNTQQKRGNPPTDLHGSVGVSRLCLLEASHLPWQNKDLIWKSRVLGPENFSDFLGRATLRFIVMASKLSQKEPSKDNGFNPFFPQSGIGAIECTSNARSILLLCSFPERLPAQQVHGWVGKLLSEDWNKLQYTAGWLFSWTFIALKFTQMIPSLLFETIAFFASSVLISLLCM